MNFTKNYYEQPELWEINFIENDIERRRISETINFIPNDVQTILDVGCGNGAFVNALPPKYEKIVGIDSSQEALKHVKVESIRGDIKAISYKKESFDLVACLEVLEHLPYETIGEALSEIERVSRKYIILSVPNNEILEYHLVICPSCKCNFNPHYHVRNFNPDGMTNLFEHFKRIKLKEIGPLEVRPTYNKVLFTAYRTWRKELPPKTSICPQCGYRTKQIGSSTISNQHSSIQNILDMLRPIWKPLIKVVWRPIWSKKWLLVLYEKNK